MDRHLEIAYSGIVSRKTVNNDIIKKYRYIENPNSYGGFKSVSGGA